MAIAFPVILTSVFVIFLLGIALGFLFRHMLKFAIGMFALVIILLALGYIQPVILSDLVSVFSPEASGIGSDFGLLVPYEGVALAGGLIIGLWKG